MKIEKQTVIAGLSLLGIVLYGILRYSTKLSLEFSNLPLYVTLIGGGIPLLGMVGARLWAKDFGADLLAAIAILTSAILGQYLAGAILVLMLSGGEALEQFATRRASAVLEALAKRMPRIAHRKTESGPVDVSLDIITAGDILVVFPQEICPVDGVVIEGHGHMDESFLTCEPYDMGKAPGSKVLSGAINQNAALVIRAEKRAADSRYAKIMQVMRAAEEDHPHLRRIGDQLGAWYTPLTLVIAALAGWISHDSMRFLSVLVIATPCPMIIAIPIAVIGAISISARHGIIIKTPAVLEQISTCRTIIFDKTGTLTYGRPRVSEILCAPGVSRSNALTLSGSLERYSKHPLAGAIVAAAQEEKLSFDPVLQVTEEPGKGLHGEVAGQQIQVTGRSKVPAAITLPPATEGLECVLLINGAYGALFRFRDVPREESRSFINHLSPRHQVTKIMIVSGDRESAVRYLAEEVGITEILAGQSPEEKVEIVRKETQFQKTLFIGDGINDAPALMAATVGIAFGQNSDITSEAADAVILETSLKKVDELFHISRRMRMIALQSAIGGMVLSLIGMGAAVTGHLPPVTGAIAQEMIDLLAVLNALRMAVAPKELSDF